MKRKLKNKLEQLEKSFSELAKDVAELKQKENALTITSEHTKNLEVDFENVETKLEVGKWYKVNNISEYLLLFNGKERSYGFYNGKWGCWSFTRGSNQKEAILATPSEVEQVLIAEAKKRGLRIDVKISRKFDNSLEDLIIDSKTYQSDPEFYYNLEEDYLEHHGFVVYSKGKWAEIIEETPIKEEDAIDWSKPQLFIGKTTKCVVMSNGKTGIESFEANLVALPEGEISSYYKIPNYFNDCSKKDYELFKGTLTINKE